MKIAFFKRSITTLPVKELCTHDKIGSPMQIGSTYLNNEYSSSVNKLKVVVAVNHSIQALILLRGATAHLDLGTRGD